MTWTLLGVLALLLVLALASIRHRRAQLKALGRSLASLEEAKARGSHRAQLQYPIVDLTRCLGCGTCIRACPEEGVLELIHGQAVVVHGARCVGHGLCAVDCPTEAIAVTLSDLGDRRDIPAITDGLEAKGSPGLFLAGEVSGFALIRTAISQGAMVADEVARRAAGGNGPGAPVDGMLDLLIVGAGPAGISCSLRAKERGLRFHTIEQEDVGGTVAKYPRRKLVMTQPVDLPLHGRLKRTTYLKEELIDLWLGVVEANGLEIQTETVFTGLSREEDGTYRVLTNGGEFRARHVCLCLGRRGTPRKLGIPGEDLPKVTYSLVDAQSYQGRRLLVVGGGDSAVEAAVGLSEQPGNEVTLSYRKKSIFRVKAKNEARLARAIDAGKIRPLFGSNVLAVEREAVHIEVTNGAPAPERMRLDNDDVFIMAGGIPPFKLLEESGVSFDPKDREMPPTIVEQGTGVMVALAVALVLALASFAFSLFHADYYALPLAERLASEKHALLRPSGPLGLVFGLAACALMLFNISYLLRRSRLGGWLPGTLKTWMSSHMLTGILALLCVLLHSALTPRDTVGGHALIALAVLVVTGAIGRYFYAFVPRAANGQVMAADDVKDRLTSLSTGWDRLGQGFGTRVREEVEALISAAPWRQSFLRRVFGLVTGQRQLGRTLARMRAEGRREGIPEDQLENLMTLARRGHRVSLMAAHYEDLRGLLATWRYLHRWVSLLMFILAAIHIVTAVKFTNLPWGALWVFGTGGGTP